MPVPVAEFTVGLGVPGIPSGGAAGQVLTKESSADYDAGWETVAASALRQFVAKQFGPMPGSVGSAGMYRVPFFGGASVTFTLSRASLHLETAGSTTTTLVIEKSSTVGGFIAVTVATLTLAASATQVDVTASLGTLASGDLIRFRWAALGTGAQSFYAQLEGSG